MATEHMSMIVWGLGQGDQVWKQEGLQKTSRKYLGVLGVFFAWIVMFSQIHKH